MEDRHEYLQKELKSLREEVHQQGIRLVLAEAWVRLYQKAYDALLHFGVNFKGLKEYTKNFPHEAHKLPISQARNVIIAWMQRMEGGIEAAVRRKQLKVHRGGLDFENPDET